MASLEGRRWLASFYQEQASLRNQPVSWCWGHLMRVCVCL